MRFFRPLLALVFVFSLLVTAVPSIASTPATAIQKLLGLSKPPAAMPYVYVERNGNGVRGVIAEVIPLPLEHVVGEIILCYGDFPTWFPLQKDARYVTEVQNQRGRIYGALEFPWPIGVRDFEADIHGYLDENVQPDLVRIEFDRVPGTGNMKQMFGSWKLQRYGKNSTLVVYDSTADFDTWVPGFLLARGTKQFLPAIMDRMKKRTAKCPAEKKPKGELPI